MCKPYLLISLAASFLVLADLSATLLENGGFEQPRLGREYLSYGVGGGELEGWVVVEGAVTVINGWKDTVAAEGAQWLSLQSHDELTSGEITRSFKTIPGNRYRLVFSYAALSPGDYRVWRFRYAVGDEWTTVSTIDRGVPRDTLTAWKTRSDEFVATGTETRISFQGVFLSGFYGSAIDAVQVTDITQRASIPEPHVFSLWVSLCCVLAVFLRRRRQSRSIL